VQGPIKAYPLFIHSRENVILYEGMTVENARAVEPNNVVSPVIEMYLDKVFSGHPKTKNDMGFNAIMLVVADFEP
jgi:hypothetical protein